MKNNICYNCMETINIETGACPNCGFNLLEYETQPHQLIPGTLLRDRYIVGRVLGEGGFGITYVGIDSVLNLKVAIKEYYMAGYVNRNNNYSTIVQASIGTYAEMFEKKREKFLSEARVLAKFSSEEGIVWIRDYFQENNTAYLVMEFLGGGTLKDHLEHNGKIPWQEVLALMDPVLCSLANIHEHDIIHRDISPDNIMFTADNKVKLVDFGAARQISKTDIKSLSIILKPGYAPEEQYRSKGMQGPWTDVYALCATMYRCITGYVPDDSMERMYDDRLKAPAEFDGMCPIAISNVLMKGLAVRQVDRYQSIGELREKLAEALKDPENVDFEKGSHTESYIKPIIGGEKTVVAEEIGVNSTPNPAPTPEPKPAPDPAPAPTPESKPAPKPAPTPTPEPARKRNKKKTIIIAVSSVAVVLIALVIVLIVSSMPSSTPSQGIPDSFTSSVILNDEEFAIPTSLSEFVNAGWISEDESELQQGVKPNGLSSITLSNGYGSVSVRYFNPTSNTLNITECPVIEIHLSNRINVNYLNEDINTFSFPGIDMELIFYQTIADEFEEYAPDGYGIDSSGYLEYYYSNSSSHDLSEADEEAYVFSFDSDKRLSSITIRNTDTSIVMTDTYSMEKPAYDEAAFEAAAGFPEWSLTIGDYEYATAIPVQEYIDNGWTLEKAPEYVASKGTDTVYLRRDTFNTIIVQVINPFENALIPEYCFVNLDLSATSKIDFFDKGFLLKTADGAVAIQNGTTVDAFEIMLTNADVSFYTYDDDIILKPYGADDARQIYMHIYDNEVASVHFECAENIYGYFENTKE